ncbi:MAG TPA: glycosyltransferase [Candidatus Paceibacterota bacterium]
MKNIVVIPTYNERETIEHTIRAVFKAQQDINILIVDDNSPDGTQTVVDRLIKEFPQLSIMRRKGKEGLGKAYISAFIELIKNPEINTIITMDADFSHDPKHIPLMLEKRKTYDVVIGSRYTRGGGIVGWELWRRFLSLGGNTYTRLITRIPIHDVTAGFIAISADALKKIGLEEIGSSGYAFLIELKYILYKSGARMTEIPIIFKNRIVGESKISNHIITEGVKAPWRLVFRKSSRHISCIACGDMKHIKYAYKNGYTIYKCTQCKMLSVYPLPKSLTDIYTEDYFSGAKNGFGYVDYDIDKEAMKGVFIDYIDRIDKIIKNNINNKIPKRLLDIGAATGYFMNIARSAGYEVTGIEISPTAVVKAKEKGLNVFSGTIESFDSKDKKFNVITLLDVLEHVENPYHLISVCRKMLDKNGLIVINTPDSRSLYARLLGKRWHLIVPPEHLYYFNRQVLTNLLDKEGFDIITSTTIGKSFTVEYIFLTLGKWLKVKMFFKITSFLKRHPALGHISLPINLRDNMFIIARIKNI